LLHGAAKRLPAFQAFLDLVKRLGLQLRVPVEAISIAVRLDLLGFSDLLAMICLNFWQRAWPSGSITDNA
jgi:hypothetical protein